MTVRVEKYVIKIRVKRNVVPARIVQQVIYVLMDYAPSDVVLMQIVLMIGLVKMANAKILVTSYLREYRVEIIRNVMSMIIELFACVLMGSRENRILNVSGILVTRMTIVRQTRNVVQTKFVEIRVWSKVLADQMHNVELRIEWLIVRAHLGIMEMLNSNASQVNII
jgi:hypothetical protein